MTRQAGLLLLGLAACAGPKGKTATAAPHENPFLAASPLQYQAPPFDRITDGDYQPAIDEGIRQNLAEMDAIARQDSAPSFANTIEAMERSGLLLTRVAKVFFAIVQANTDDTLQKVQADVAPKLAAFRDSIYLDPRLFRRVKALYDQREQLGLDAEQKFLVGKYYRDFVRAGAQLTDADKARLRELNKEESTLSTDFQNKLLNATNAAALVVEHRADLAGLSDGDVATAAEEAKSRKLEGKWVLALRNTTQQPL
ncbi:MAG TPA: hypothetical protein VL241_08190, partial [Gemmatimonadales bacterium]|nr:hypothetical protein [Gemmatimonadales bacterium]